MTLYKKDVRISDFDPQIAPRAPGEGRQVHLTNLDFVTWQVLKKIVHQGQGRPVLVTIAKSEAAAKPSGLSGFGLL